MRNESYSILIPMTNIRLNGSSADTHATRSAGDDLPATLGGMPLLATTPDMRWPPTDAQTEQQLVELYRSQSWSFGGAHERAFCEEFASAHSAAHAVFMVNGTVTLEAILHALGIGEGDEVIVPALTWPATAMAVVYNRAVPVFVDIEPDTLCIDPEQVRQAITPRTRAIIPVHLYGGMADMDRLAAVAQPQQIALVEDCAHAHGGAWDGKGLGSIGIAGSFSFQQSKTMSAGEGGAVITNDAALAERLYRFKHIGYAPNTKQGQATGSLTPDLICHNYRATEFQAMILRQQLKHLNTLARRRDDNAMMLTEGLERIPGVRAQARGTKAGPQSYYCYMVTLDLEAWSNATCAQIRAALKKEGIPVAPTYGSVYRHPLWNLPASRYRIHGDRRDALGPVCPVAESIGTQRTLGVPHQVLDWSEENRMKLIAAFQKVHRHADRIAQIQLPA